MFIVIHYENDSGILNTETNEVYFYHLKYININEAVQKLKYDKIEHADIIKALYVAIPPISIQ